MDKYSKISASLKTYYETHDGNTKGMKLDSPSQELIDKRRAKQLATWDAKGRVTEEQKKARNKANVYAYRARKRNAIPADADLKLITKIYEACPVGYHVDHRIALAVGGLHHQDNLQYLPSAENCRKGKNGKYDESLAIQWNQIIPQ